MNKKIFKNLITFSLIFTTSILLSSCKKIELKDQIFYKNSNTNLKYISKTNGKNLQLYDGSKFKNTYIKGVNIGSAKPFTFPGELGVTYDEYYRWFEYISDMNSNSIRVYTIMNPCFYDALYDYNNTHTNKLYLFQGLWYNEDKLSLTNNAFDILDEAISDGKNLVDILHGNITLEEKVGHASGTYTKDISNYTFAWILGIESDATLVNTTNNLNSTKTNYDGTFLYTDNASAYEVFMSNLADEIIKYEASSYETIRPISWSNWPTADPLNHPYESDKLKEDNISVDIEHIKVKKNFTPGIFASYHVYPYYPEFMMSEEYNNAIGKNSYKAYLKDLLKHHTYPVLVAEYGVPSSRGNTHIDEVNGFNQGGLTEDEQGKILEYLTKSIKDAGCCGSLCFTFQDEWFKRTWNTMDYTNSDRRPFFKDVQTSEQCYGLLTFESDDLVIIDGKVDEWTKEDEIISDDNYSLSIKHDLGYLYLMVKKNNKNINFDNSNIIIPIDLIDENYLVTYNDISYDKAYDFILDFNGKTNTKLMVKANHDRYAYYFGKYDSSYDSSELNNSSTTIYKDIYLNVKGEKINESTNIFEPAKKVNTGLLTYGITNPNSKDFNSLADYYYTSDYLEIRIPWILLNFKDPSTKEVEGMIDNNFSKTNINDIKIALSYKENDCFITLGSNYTYDNWDNGNYHERLKKSYYYLKKVFSKI